MTSEIRANTLKNRVGLGTISFTNTGPVVSGIVTIANSTTEGVTLEDNAGVGNSLKITTPTGYVSIGSGNAAFVHFNTDRGSYYFQKRIIVDEGIIGSYDENLTLQSPLNTNRVTINKDTGLFSILNDLDVDGHTNLDNVSVAGVTTFSGNADFSSGIDITGGNYTSTGNFVTNGTMNVGSYAVFGAVVGADPGSNYYGTTNRFGGGVSISGALNIDGDIGHIGDTNTKIRFPTNDTFSVETAGSERLRIDSGGRVLINRTNNDAPGGNASKLQIRDTTYTASISVVRNDPGGGGPSLVFGKSRNATQSDNTLVQDGDNLGQISFFGADGNDMNSTGAMIVAQVDGTPGSNDMPGRLVFKTTADGAASATERLRIKSNGKIGINNNNPTHPLHIVNTSSTFNSASLIKGDTSTSGGGAYVTFTNTADSKSAYFGVDGNGLFNINAGAALVGTNGDESIIFCTNGNSQKARITSNGLVETSSTFGIANVGGTIGGSGGLENWIGLKDSSGNYGLIMKTHSQTAGYVRNVGINETNPRQRLHVHDDTNYQGILINGNSAPRIAFARSTTTTGEWSVGIDGTNGNNFVINRSNDNSNRLFVMSNGQTNLNQNTAITGVLFNNDIRSITATNDDSTSNVKISARNAAAGHGNYCIIGVSGNTYFGAGANNYSSNPSGNNINGGTTIRVYGGISSNAYNDAHRFGRNTDGSIVIFQSAGGTEGSIAISGSTTNYNTSSDYRLKENIVNITDGITRLKQLKPRRFNFIKDPSITKDGFIAHEVDSVVPEAVTGTKDETFSKDDEANNVKAGDPKYQHMDASKLIPLLTAALQEAITEIETLKTKVAALEGS